MKTSSQPTTKEASTSKKTNTPLPVKPTQPALIKTTENPKYTTAGKDGGKAEQSGDSGGGGNNAVFAAAGVAGGVVVLVGVGVTVFICRRRGRNSEACGVPMHRLEQSNNPKTDNQVADVEVENPLYGTMGTADRVGLAVADSCA
ncbi:Hypp3279 [Branchiostoma lanceolatum]|uniref:Hypp3279 protein n=1 Tax=Branchiostoma lanceolatum TaxID=7740 RepID=A0A8J9ZYM1_BRALA|nr:Hypp3279 [Branchiostoma lanceolatum]